MLALPMTMRCGCSAGCGGETYMKSLENFKNQQMKPEIMNLIYGGGWEPTEGSNGPWCYTDKQKIRGNTVKFKILEVHAC